MKPMTVTIAGPGFTAMLEAGRWHCEDHQVEALLQQAHQDIIDRGLVPVGASRNGMTDLAAARVLAQRLGMKITAVTDRPKPPKPLPAGTVD